jgi:hypothetical protein
LALAAIANLAVGRETLRLAAVLLICALAVLAIVFCTYWIAQIDDAKQLNNAKFKVLQEMAPRVIFDSSGEPSPAKSFSPFQREWELLSASQALAEVPNGQGRRLLVLRGGSAENFVPKSFRILFIVFLIGTIVLLATSFKEVTKYPSPFSNVPSPMSSVHSHTSGPTKMSRQAPFPTPTKSTK